MEVSWADLSKPGTSLYLPQFYVNVEIYVEYGPFSRWVWLEGSKGCRGLRMLLHPLKVFSHST